MKEEQLTKAELRKQFVCKPVLEFDPKQCVHEHLEGLSETVDGQSLTIKEVLIRYNNGTLPDISQSTYYEIEDPDDDQSFEMIDETLDPAYDITDAHKKLEELKYKQKEIDKDIKAKRVNVEEKANNRSAKK